MEDRSESQIEGRRPVIEALRAGRALEEIWISQGSRPSGALAEIVRMARRQGVTVREVPRREIEERARTRNPQGVIATSNVGFEYATLDDLLGRATGTPALFVALDGVTDPQNLGALARSAEAAGAHGLIVGKRRAAPVTDVARRTSAGALEHLPVARVTNIPSALETLKEAGVWIVALDATSERTIYDLDGTDPLCLVVGGEGSGVSRLVAERADHLVSIPMAGKVSSLNASAAGAVALFEIGRQRG